MHNTTRQTRSQTGALPSRANDRQVADSSHGLVQGMRNGVNRLIQMLGASSDDSKYLVTVQDENQDPNLKRVFRAVKEKDTKRMRVAAEPSTPKKGPHTTSYTTPTKHTRYYNTLRCELEKDAKRATVAFASPDQSSDKFTKFPDKPDAAALKQVQAWRTEALRKERARLKVDKNPQRPSEIHITYDQIKKIRKQGSETRKPAANTIFERSAKAWVTPLLPAEELEKHNYNFLHIFGAGLTGVFEDGRSQAQYFDNFVLGTAAGNSAMLPWEVWISGYLTRHQKETVTLSAKVIWKAHYEGIIAERLDYTITIKGLSFTVPFIPFDANGVPKNFLLSVLAPLLSDFFEPGKEPADDVSRAVLSLFNNKKQSARIADSGASSGGSLRQTRRSLNLVSFDANQFNLKN